ncbi:cupin-like domain-containing protein [Algibacillus agarilyticus]|uniref:cupin-like domain-containing protein n=1 Tax=Algibacillus agarilyticus TaxID=2234133 RepID=UPI001E5C90C7|nr:cupin-like domain-containing protein [Algibacillus agarilyticus]
MTQKMPIIDCRDTAVDLVAEPLSSVLQGDQPYLLKGLIAHWPSVALAQQSTAQFCQHLADLYQGKPIGAFVGEPEINGRFFYNDDLTALNFNKHSVKFDHILTELLKQQGKENPHTFYVGSAHIDSLLPTFTQHNNLPWLNEMQPHVSIWVGNKSRIAAHQDFPQNIACCVAGQRRFTLFPPDQLANLYVGPLDLTPAGQAISLVDFHNPDFKQHPKFAQALEGALIADLEPGDAVFIPSSWWHHVEALAEFNVLVNYWWQQTANYMGSPQDALLHALLNIRDLPAPQKQACKAMFDYYVFNDDPQALKHIPEEQLGILAQHSPIAARQIRAMLLNNLNR